MRNKFRVWCKTRKRWRDFDNIYIEQDGGVFELVEHDYSQYLEEITDSVEVVRFTGLKDKNGKEIYEGDILGWSYYCGGEPVTSRSVVKWDESDCGFDFGDYGRPSFCEREVIGNIYENQELLERGEG